MKTIQGNDTINKRKQNKTKENHGWVGRLPFRWEICFILKLIIIIVSHLIFIIIIINNSRNIQVYLSTFKCPLAGLVPSGREKEHWRAVPFRERMIWWVDSMALLTTEVPVLPRFSPNLQEWNKSWIWQSYSPNGQGRLATPAWGEDIEALMRWHLVFTFLCS